MEYAGISWTAAARKHRVSRMQIRHVIDQAVTVFVREAQPPGRPDEALLILGEDSEGVRLEVVVVVLDDGRLRVIHAMPMRAQYTSMFEEADK